MFQSDPFTLILIFVGITLLPFVAMIATSYLKIVVVMSLIRNALGIQSIPPNMVVNALAMILSFFIMAPVCSESWAILMEQRKAAGVNQPTQEMQVVSNGLQTLSPEQFAPAAEPFRKWLAAHTADRQRAFFVNTAERLWSKNPDEPALVDPESFWILIPSFCVSELTKAFQIGFLVYLPFIAIDIIVSNILLAMGMMMVSPTTISLPFKMLLFVMANGWTLLVQGLVRGYAV